MPEPNTPPVLILGRNAYRLVEGDIQRAPAIDRGGNPSIGGWTYIDLDDWNDECDRAMAMLGGVATRQALDRLNEFAQTAGTITRSAAAKWAAYCGEADKALAQAARARPL